MMVANLAPYSAKQLVVYSDYLWDAKTAGVMAENSDKNVAAVSVEQKATVMAVN